MNDAHRHEAWNLGQWYVELLLLRKLGYRGKYISRLATWHNGVETIQLVPWAHSQDEPGTRSQLCGLALGRRSTPGAPLSEARRRAQPALPECCWPARMGQMWPSNLEHIGRGIGGLIRGRAMRESG